VTEALAHFRASPYRGWRPTRENPTMSPRPPPLASKPTYVPALQTVFFEFWKGNVKQAGSFKVPNMAAEAALDYFMTNWAQISVVATRTPPINGEVKLRFADPGI
jgi:hypothetical protein